MNSLSVILAQESLEHLRTLASWWGAEAPREDSIEARQQFERAMRDAVAARFVWERLDADERKVMFAVAGPSARNWCALDALADRAKLDESVALAALARLEEAHLVWTETARVQGAELVGQRVTFYGYALPRNTQAEIEEKRIAYIPTELVTGLFATGRELFVGHADRSTKTMDELLMPYRQGDLDQIGRRFGLAVQAYYSRNEVRSAMAQNLTQAEAVRFALSRIGPRLADFYDWLRECGGRAPVAEARKRLHVSEPELGRIIHTFEEYMLAFDTFSEGKRILFIPSETLENLSRADARGPVVVGLREVPEPRAIQPANPVILWDLAVLVAAAYHQEIELTRTGSLPKRAAQRILPLLVSERAHGPERSALDYVEMLKQEAVELGLVVAPASTAKRHGTLAPGPKLEAWARHDLVMQARRLYRLWPADRWWVDLPGANYREWLAYYLETQLAREAVKHLLTECKAHVWYSLASFRATIQGDDPFVLRPSQRYAGEAGFKLSDELHAHWDETDGELVAGMLRSTLAELGLVALGYDRDTVPGRDEVVNPTCFMLTDVGYEVLHSELSAREQPSSRAMVVQPNFQIFLLEPHMPAFYWLLRYASVEQIGQVSRFALTADALQRGLAHGGTIDEVLAFLEHHSQKALPQNVAYMLRDWSRTTRAQGMVIDFEAEKIARAEELAGELVTDPKLRAFKLERIGPSTIQVPPEASLRDLRSALERLGYSVILPVLESLMLAARQLAEHPQPPRPRASRRRASSPRSPGTPAIEGFAGR